MCVCACVCACVNLIIFVVVCICVCDVSCFLLDAHTFRGEVLRCTHFALCIAL